MNSILVVDDDDVFRNRLIKAFQERGLNSLSAANLELTLTPSKSLPSAPAPSLARAEWEHIQRVLSDCSGNISHAAKQLGLPRRSLQRKLIKLPPKE